jgi:hypothetical protein
MIFSDSEIVPKGTGNKYTLNNTSHSTQMFTDKIESLESREENKSKFTGSRGTVKLMRDLTRRQSNQSQKLKTVNYYYQCQILEPNCI